MYCKNIFNISVLVQVIVKTYEQERFSLADSEICVKSVYNNNLLYDIYYDVHFSFV